MKVQHLFAWVATCVAAVAFGAGSPLAPYFTDLPTGTDPGTISRRITDQFLSSRPENYRPKGYHGNEGYGWNKSVQYSVVSLWVNAIACARLDGDKAREEKLIRLFDDFLPGRPKNRCCSRPYHVDDTIFGALPYEIYLANKDPRCLEMGNFYADTQWTPPCEGTLKERHMPSKEVQEAFWAKGYTPQTRLWIDDMYMITVLQSQAFRATGDRKYIDRAAREMCLYLDELQLKDGKAKGLFYHAPDVKYVWGRGDGWMAAGMALVLDRLPADSEYRPRILEGYHLMMSTLLKFQRPDGLWAQLVDMPDDPRNWGETSCTAMFTYAFMTGVARGWLKAEDYGPAARKAWLALCARLDTFANISDVCVGTGKKDNLQYYFDRPRVNGDPHGQAPMLWMSSVLLETGAGRLTGLRTPATSKLFEKRVDPVSGVVSYLLLDAVAEDAQVGKSVDAKTCAFAVKLIPNGGRSDPPPYFSADGKWVVSTSVNPRKKKEILYTDVAQLVARTTMETPQGGKTVVVENPIDVARPAETVSVKWADLGLKAGDTAVRVWDVAANVPVAFQDDRKNGALIFSTALAANERKEFQILADATLPQADLSIVCWSLYLPERMDDFAWENDRFGARVYGPIIMQPAPLGQKLVSSGVDIINKCVSYPVLHRWFVQRTGEGSYHKDHGEGMDNYKVGPSRGCGGLGMLSGEDWKFSINWSKTKVIQCGPVRTEFEITYPGWGGFGGETRRMTLDRGQFFAHCLPRFKGKMPAGAKVGPGLDCSQARSHNGDIARDLNAGWIANWEPDGVDGKDTGSIATALILDPVGVPATTAVDKLGCEYLFPPANRATKFGYWAGATWSGAKAVKDAKAWHALVRDFARGLRNPVKVSLK